MSLPSSSLPAFLAPSPLFRLGISAQNTHPLRRPPLRNCGKLSHAARLRVSVSSMCASHGGSGTGGDGSHSPIDSTILGEADAHAVVDVAHSAEGNGKRQEAEAHSPTADLPSPNLSRDLEQAISGQEGEEEEEEEDEFSVIQGPSQAPTGAGVSTVGLDEKDAKFFALCYDADVKGIQKCLDEGQNVNVKDVNRRSALHFCAGNGLHSLCKKLLELGAEIDTQDITGYTPLHMATGYKKVTTLKFLVQEGADANIESNNGELAVEIAERLLAKTPKKKFFLDNEDYAKINEIVEILDGATELEDDGEEGEEEIEEFEEETENAKFVVRVKPRDAVATPPSPPPKIDPDVKVTIRVNKPKP